MGDVGDGALPAAGLTCSGCGTRSGVAAKYCSQCGTPLRPSPALAEYKQVTVLFADMVRSMDLAAQVGPERLREIMADLADRCAAVVQRYAGTVDKFTGDGIMAVFGAPVALEDHAMRACLAALGVQDAAKRLSLAVRDRDGVELWLRIGLNSGQVIAGELGSGPFGYTAVGEQVGMAQRMEAVAPPGGVMLSESTARLVEDAVVLGEPEMLDIKNATAPVAARRLIATTGRHRHGRRNDPTLVGRTWELNTVAAILDEAFGGAGCVVSVQGPPGIGKSRIVREAAALAADRGVEVFTAYCESHTNDIPFHAVTALLHAALGTDGLDGDAARTQVHARFPYADPEDLLLMDDLLGIAEPGAALPNVGPDARRRRLTALVIATWVARGEPALYVIEDAHWIDETSESMLAEFFAVVSQTHSLVLITYRPHYRGALATIHGAQTIALRPLSTGQTATLTGELLGPHTSVRDLAQRVAAHAGGNPFFAEEIVRDLAERGAIRGTPGSYVLHGDAADIAVPATLQAAIAARVDRLSRSAKRTLSAAAVIGSRFTPEPLSALMGTEPVLDELVATDLIDQVGFSPRVEYAFRHPLIRSVAYESQLKADRAELHRQLAAAIQRRDPDAADANAGMVAEHLESAGDLRAAFDWHMRAGAWLTHRDLTAARGSWQRAREVADRLPDDASSARAALRIAPRTLLCASAWLAGGSMADTGFEELRELADGAGDKTSLAMGMSGWVATLITHARFQDASRWSSELTTLLESIGDPTLLLGLAYPALAAKLQTGEIAALLQLAQRMIDLADGDPTRGNLVIGSPLIAALMLRGCGRCCVADARWRDDVERASTMARPFEVTTRALMLLFKSTLASRNGALLLDEAFLEESAEVLEAAERSGHDLTLATAEFVRGLALVTGDDPRRDEGCTLLAAAREAALQERFTMVAAAGADAVFAMEKARAGDLDGAVDLARGAVEWGYSCGALADAGRATDVLVEALLRRGADADLREAEVAIDRLAAVPTEPAFVVNELWLLRMRALQAQAHGDTPAYRTLRDRYRHRAAEIGFAGHLQFADEMP
ncbi:adenylate/guanylate cyclase domain-containing protein [Mycobacterium sp. PS03-16]|uniref:adenylate/guanylate cyclase domain-containing protein n=1 Tax=Mycobacterium sp. PS03-16 TaxID=2559611 RepID=UPI001FD7A1F7|nr:adenylate/guanylate cyclase domain-containing protein [Mycobacterium sp. PS03-16]